MALRSGIAVVTVLGAGLGMGIGLPALHAAYAAPAASAHKTVKVTEVNSKYGFALKKITVKVGTKVTWMNTTDAPHTVTGSGTWKFSSATFAHGKSVSFTFKKAGTFHYFCSIHPYMKATVVVKK